MMYVKVTLTNTDEYGNGRDEEVIIKKRGPQTKNSWDIFVSLMQAKLQAMIAEATELESAAAKARS